MSNEKLSSPSVSVLKYASVGDLAGLLDALSRFGQPRLAMGDNGWNCCVDLFVSTLGTTLTVRSDFGHPTHLASVGECTQRVIEVIEKMAKQACPV